MKNLEEGFVDLEKQAYYVLHKAKKEDLNKKFIRRKEDIYRDKLFEFEKKTSKILPQNKGNWIFNKTDQIKHPLEVSFKEIQNILNDVI